MTLAKMQSDVEAFHRLAGVGIGDLAAPAIPTQEERDLRIELITEELHELIEAFQAEDLPGAADAVADILYVTFGTAVVLGIDIHAVWDEIHAANMRKFPGGVVLRRPDGKILKSPDWQGPDIARVIRDQILQANLDKELELVTSRFDFSDTGDDEPTIPLRTHQEDW